MHDVRRYTLLFDLKMYKIKFFPRQKKVNQQKLF